MTPYRVIPIPDMLIPKLKYGESYYLNNYVFFTDKLGKNIDNKKPNRHLKSTFKKINIDPIKFHGLRKTYVTRLFENGIPPKTVQVLMGHPDITMTLNLYTEVMEEQKQEAVDTLNNIFNFLERSV